MLTWSLSLILTFLTWLFWLSCDSWSSKITFVVTVIASLGVNLSPEKGSESSPAIGLNTAKLKLRWFWSLSPGTADRPCPLLSLALRCWGVWWRSVCQHVGVLVSQLNRAVGSQGNSGQSPSVTLGLAWVARGSGQLRTNWSHLFTHVLVSLYSGTVVLRMANGRPGFRIILNGYLLGTADGLSRAPCATLTLSWRFLCFYNWG